MSAFGANFRLSIFEVSKTIERLILPYGRVKPGQALRLMASSLHLDMSRKLPRALALALAIAALLLPAAAFGQDDPEAPPAPSAAAPEGYVEGAEALEGRLLAPCCWTQTIDIHGSEIANDLRREIRRRLKAGESADAIEADIVSRYGERIRAVPPDSPLKSLAVWLTVLMGAAGVGAAFMLVRWKRRQKESEKKPPKKSAKSKRDRLDDEIDAELEQL